MKYYLANESQTRALKYHKRAHGIVSVVSENFAHLLRIEHLSSETNLTPWLRRQDALAFDVPQWQKDKAPVEIPASEIRRYIRAARQAQNSGTVEISIHAISGRYGVQARMNGRIAARFVQSIGELRALLLRLKLKYQKIRIAVIGHSLADLIQVFRMDFKASIIFEAERLQELRVTRSGELREVLVFTNLAGQELSHLESSLPFWAKGIAGFRFRHIFGSLTAKRIESVLALKAWDILIYRGHGTIADGAMAWTLAEGHWVLPPLSAEFYMHLSCLAHADELRIECMPAPKVLTPLLPIEDFDDAAFVRLFLERYKASANLGSAVRSTQEVFPQFVYIST